MNSVGVGHRDTVSKKRFTAKVCHDLRGPVVLLQNNAVAAFVVKNKHLSSWYLETGPYLAPRVLHNPCVMCHQKQRATWLLEVLGSAFWNSPMILEAAFCPIGGISSTVILLRVLCASPSTTFRVVNAGA